MKVNAAPEMSPSLAFPAQEHIICGLKIQGLFLKRQEEVSSQFAKIVAGEILTSQAMWEVGC